MSKQPILITCQPDDEFFIFQNHLYIESCIEAGFKEEQIHILLYKPTYRVYNKNWDKLKEYYPQLNIFLYEDKGVQQHLGVYIPILRPHILWQHFEKFPELEKETIIYTDCDILWLQNLDIEKLFDNEVCYISDAHSYLNVDYFSSKVKDVLPEKLEQYKKRDVIKELCEIVGIDKQVVIDNNLNTGGVQYIFKGVNAAFFKKVEKDTLAIRNHLLLFNRDFFKNENSGVQSWCADLWGILYNLWYRKKEVKVVEEMRFLWSPDPISKLNTCSIFHNAGVTGETMHGNVPCFFKGKYVGGSSPFSDIQLDNIMNNEESKKYCTHYYVQKLIELKEKYNLH